MAGNQNSGNQNAAQNLDDQARSRGGSMRNGNFKNDPQRASEAGRKGGQSSQGGERGNQDQGE